jgi:hypothetical protein
VPKKDYIPELSEVRMVRRAPGSPFPLGEDDRKYVRSCLQDVEAAFSVEGFPGLAFDQIPARALIKRLIDWWRTLEPLNEAQREAHGRLPSAIRLLDTVSIWLEERAQRDASGRPR